MGKKPVLKKPARQPTRVPCLPPWASVQGISAEAWQEADRQQKERWRWQYLYEDDSGESDDEAESRPLHGPNYREYRISGLDLSVASDALNLHKWKDEHCLRKVIDLLEQGGGGMTFMTFFSRVVNRGRLYLEWPTPLHVNKEFRACLLYPTREHWTDLDMTNAHCYICLYLAVLVGLTMPALLDYIAQRRTYRNILTRQGVSDAGAKQLWLSLLNSGTVAGWKHKQRQSEGGVCVDLKCDNLDSHLKSLREEIVRLRTQVLDVEPWSSICRDMEAENSRDTRHRKKAEPLRRSIWNCVLCTVETQVIQVLSEYVTKHSTAIIAMPSYDGLLLQHGPDEFSWSETMQSGWSTVCSAQWDFWFPVESKDVMQHLPAWMAEIMRLRAALGP